jgi:hypothetical protein
MDAVISAMAGLSASSTNPEIERERDKHTF